MALSDMLVSFGADTTNFNAGVADVISGLTDVGNSAVESASTLASDLTSASDDAAQAVTNLGNQANETASQTNSFLGTISNGISSITNFGQSVIGQVTGLQSWGQGIYGQIQNFFALNSSMEQTQVGFDTIMHSSSAAKDYLAQLWQFSANTPFEFPQVTSAAQQLMAFGYNAKDVIPDLTSMGDALSAMGRNTPDALSRVVYAFGQMHAAGKINAGDMMQLTSLGISGWQILADKMHLSVTQVQDLSRRGLLPADEAIKNLISGMEGLYGGSMQAQSQTFNGIISTLNDNISGAMRAFAGPLFDQAKQALIQLATLVSSSAFQNFAAQMGQVVGGALQTITNIIVGVVIPSFTLLQQVVTNNLSFFQELAGIFNSGFGEAFGDIGSAIYDVLSPAFKSLHIDLSPLQQDFDKLKPVILDVAKNAMSELVIGAKDLATAIRSLPGIIDDVSNTFTTIYDIMLNRVSPTFRLLHIDIPFVQQDFEKLKPIILEVANDAMRQFDTSSNNLIITIRKLPDIIIDVANNGFKILQKSLMDTKSDLDLVWNTIEGPTINSFREIKQSVEGLFGPAMQSASSSAIGFYNASTPISGMLHEEVGAIVAVRDPSDKATAGFNLWKLATLDLTMEQIALKAAIELATVAIGGLLAQLSHVDIVNAFAHALANGITIAGDTISSQINRISNALYNSLIPAFLGLVVTVTTKIQEFSSDVVNKFQEIIGPIQQFFSEVEKKFQTFVDDVKQFFSDVISKFTDFTNITIPNVKQKIDDFFNGIGPVINGAKESVKTALKGFFDLFTLPPADGEFVVWMQTMVLPALEEAKPGFDKLKEAIAGIPDFLDKLNKAFQPLIKDALPYIRDWAQEATPILIKLSGLFSGGLGTGIEGLEKVILSFVNNAGSPLNSFLLHLNEVLGPIFLTLNQIIDFIDKNWNPIWKTMAPILYGVWLQIKGVFEIVWNLIMGAFLIWIDLMTGNWTQAWIDFQTALSGIWQGIKDFFDGLYLQYIKPGLDGVVDGLDHLSFWQNDDDPLTQMTLAMGKGLDKIGKFFETVKDNFNAFFTINLGDYIKTAGYDLMDKFSKSVMSAIHQLIPGTNQAIEKDVKSGYTDMAKNASDWGANLIDGFGAGLRARAASSLPKTLDDVAKIIKGYLGWHSPTEFGPGSDSDTWGPNLINMMATGILDGTSSLSQASRVAGMAIQSGFLGVTNNGANAAASYANLFNTNNQQTANIYVQLDSETIAKSVAQPLVNNIILKTGRGYA